MILVKAGKARWRRKDYTILFSTPMAKEGVGAWSSDDRKKFQGDGFGLGSWEDGFKEDQEGVGMYYVSTHEAYYGRRFGEGFRYYTTSKRYLDPQFVDGHPAVSAQDWSDSTFYYHPYSMFYKIRRFNGDSDGGSAMQGSEVSW